MDPNMPPTITYEDVPVGWCYLPDDNQPFFLREALNTGGYVLGRDRTGPADTVHSGHGLRRMPAWFPAGDAAGHVAQLVMILVRTAEQRDSNQFTTWVRGVKTDGVAALYSGGMYRFPTVDAFAKACSDFYDDQAFDNDHSKALATILDERELHRELQQMVETPQPFPLIPMKSYDEILQLAAALREVGKNGNHLEYDRPWLEIDKGIWTDHMGPCITVGLTALSAEGKRHNALVHSFLDTPGQVIVDALRGLFHAQNGLPHYDSLVNVAWFVVGGSPDYSSLEKAVQLVTELRTRNLPVLGVQFTTAPSDVGMSKAVVITATGQVFWGCH